MHAAPPCRRGHRDSRAPGPWGLLCAGLLGSTPVPSALAQGAPPRLPEPPLVTPEGRLVQRPDLSRLPEVEDREGRGTAAADRPSIGAPLPAELPGPLAVDPLAGRSYLGAAAAEAHVDFVPATPSAVFDARPLWEAMMRPPPSPVRDATAPRLRVAAFSLFGVSGAALIATLATLGAPDPSAAQRGVGYAMLGTSLLSVAAGGVLLTISNRRLSRLRGDLP